MIVCICKSVRERDIRELVDSSQEGLRMRDLRERLGVSSECGKCARRAHCLLQGCANEAARHTREDAPGGNLAVSLDPASLPESAVGL
ncbi:bacterioferritin-associated ferredoxin [Thioalkalivibrio sp. ALJ7]|uniref:(2Fe-2S)-binding protein n=1 Tax=Thioalkalivibrio sp. ALJ7 TaxID=1158756 RepID=UPI0009D9A927|nr:(2Fe-2S)-binding protein [Thioalkalivibrio sp. ALJ7]